MSTAKESKEEERRSLRFCVLLLCVFALRFFVFHFNFTFCYLNVLS
jgi:hypothetical protein